MADATNTVSDRLYNDYNSETPEYTDMSIQTASCKLHAHRSVVCSLSSVMKSRVAEKDDRVVSLPTTEKYVVQALLEFCYTGFYHLKYDIDDDISSPAFAHANVYLLACEFNIPTLQMSSLYHFKSCVGTDIQNTKEAANLAKFIYTQVDSQHRDGMKEAFLEQVKTKGTTFVESEAFAAVVRDACVDLAIDLCRQTIRKPIAPLSPLLSPDTRPKKRMRTGGLSGSESELEFESDTSTMAEVPKHPSKSTSPVKHKLFLGKSISSQPTKGSPNKFSKLGLPSSFSQPPAMKS